MVAEVKDDNDDVKARRVPDPSSAIDFYSKFETMETLGTGVSSVVKLCMDRKTGAEFAVKIIDVTDVDDVHEGLDAVQQVRQEIAILRLVGGHPNVADLVETYETPDFIFLVFQLCRRGELYDLLNSQVQLSERRIRNYMYQLLLAVKHCHDLGIIHRDVKPENILITDDMEAIKLTDFGLARPLDRNTKLFQLCGTPGYLAPEIYRSGMLPRSNPMCTGYGYAVDSWACGMTLFVLLFRSPPFYDSRRIQMIRKICEKDHRVGFDWDTITGEAQDLIDRLLDKDPETRMTIEEALDHEVFRNEAYLRRLNHPAYANRTLVCPHRCSGVCSNECSHEHGMSCFRERLKERTLEPSVQNAVQSSSKINHISSVKLYRMKQQREEECRVLSPVQKFRRAANVVRFIIRLSRLDRTPELAHVSMVKLRPHGFTSFQKPAGQLAFKLYNHWTKKSVVRNRVSMFQNYPKFFRDEFDECPV